MNPGAAHSGQPGGGRASAGRASAGRASAGHEVLTWAEFGLATRALAEQVVADGYEPDVILAVARGGLLPAAAVAYALDAKNIVAVNIAFYTGEDRRLDVPVMLPPFLTPEIIAGARVLVVDDVTDTGGTLELVVTFCRAHVADVRCAVVYEKPRSAVTCAYVWRRTDRWIDFPWSAQPPVRRPDVG